MKELAFVFPGQGSQKVGMGLEFYDTRPEIAHLYDRADAYLKMVGWSESLREICFQNPDERLSDTRFAQPALYVTELAIHRALTAERLAPRIVSGHSLGMYPAYVVADALSWKKGLWLVEQRGELMAKAGGEKPGKMAAILGSPIEEVERMLDGKEVDIANHNAPRQVVISGEVTAVEEVLETLSPNRYKVLNVSIAGHSRVMQPVVARYTTAVHIVGVQNPKPTVSLVVDTTGEIESRSETIFQEMVSQLTRRVLWVKSVQTMVNAGTQAFVEVGPGEVLSGLIKKIAPEVPTYHVEDEASLDELLASMPKQQ